MSKHLPLATLALALLGLCFAYPAFAADTQQTRLVGKLTAIAGKTLTIAGANGSTVTITCNDATKYRRDATNSFVSFAELVVGQTLRVYYGSDNVATLVNIVKAPGN
jgi:hypothetical protein